jgi:hypothetical protein
MRKEVGVCLYRGVHLAAGVKISTLMVPYKGICRRV